MLEISIQTRMKLDRQSLRGCVPQKLPASYNSVMWELQMVSILNVLVSLMVR